MPRRRNHEGFVRKPIERPGLGGTPGARLRGLEGPFVGVLTGFEVGMLEATLVGILRGSLSGAREARERFVRETIERSGLEGAQRLGVGSGTPHAKTPGMAARRLEDLRVWQQARTLASEVSATLDQPALCRDWALKDQLNRAALSIAANIAEGFAQQSDRAFARYLFLARASASEVRALLSIALDQEKLDLAKSRALQGRCNGVSRMLSALIRYLVTEDRVTRQVGQSRRDPASPRQ